MLFSRTSGKLALGVVVSVISIGVPTCFPDALPVNQTRNLRQANGEIYPLGLWVNDYLAAQVSSSVLRILIEERLGYNITETVTGSGSDALYALMGCSNPTTVADRGCGQPITYHHINLENWYASDLAELQAQFPAMAPINAGSMGYVGQQSVFIPKDVQRTALQEAGAWDTV